MWSPLLCVIPFLLKSAWQRCSFHHSFNRCIRSLSPLLSSEDTTSALHLLGYLVLRPWCYGQWHGLWHVVNNYVMRNCFISNMYISSVLHSAIHCLSANLPLQIPMQMYFQTLLWSVELKNRRWNASLFFIPICLFSVTSELHRLGVLNAWEHRLQSPPSSILLLVSF